MITLSRTTAIDHGRREGARSPLLFNIGAASRRMPMITGPRIITQPSNCGGINANSAKYHTRYQSGFGSALRLLGSGGASSFGGPTKYASNAITTTAPVPKTKSRHAPSGQNGWPDRKSVV